MYKSIFPFRILNSWYYTFRYNCTYSAIDIYNLIKFIICINVLTKCVQYPYIKRYTIGTFSKRLLKKPRKKKEVIFFIRDRYLRVAFKILPVRSESNLRFHEWLRGSSSLLFSFRAISVATSSNCDSRVSLALLEMRLDFILLNYERKQLWRCMGFTFSISSMNATRGLHRWDRIKSWALL